jgi:hypothetical protein
MNHFLNLNKLKEKMADTPKGQRINKFFNENQFDQLNIDQAKDVVSIIETESKNWCDIIKSKVGLVCLIGVCFLSGCAGVEKPVNDSDRIEFLEGQIELKNNQIQFLNHQIDSLFIEVNLQYEKDNFNSRIRTHIILSSIDK